MLDPIVNFFVRIFQWIGRGIGLLIGIVLWPFLWAGRWYTQRGWMLKAIVGAALLALLGLYANFFYATQWWNNFNPDYPTLTAAGANPQAASVLAGDPIAAATTGESTTGGGSAPAAPVAPGQQQTCKRSEIAAVAADLIDFNVNQNAWISSMLASKLGFFGIPWRNTPFFDNKAAFQLGINQVMRRTTTELVDTLGRTRGTSQIDQNLQNARTALAWDEDAWYVGLRGPNSSDAERLPRCDPLTAYLHRQPREMPGDVRCPLRQPSSVPGPHRWGHRLHLRHPARTDRGFGRRLVRPARRRPLLVLLRSALCLLRYSERHPIRLLGDHPRTQPDRAVGHDANSDARRP